MTKRKMVLVIDDDEDTRKLLSVLIKRLEYQIELKKDAMSAKKWLSSNKPDLILLDVMLPDITGIELCQWIGSQENLKKIPIIHITALTDETTQEDSMFSGARDFITKPIDFQKLERKIKTLLK